MDVHTLLRSTVAHLAMRDWHKMGARNESEALGVLSHASALLQGFHSGS